MKMVKGRDCGLCRYCGVAVDWLDRRGPIGGTYDHVVPVSRGGGDEFTNIVTACRGCNLKKGGRLPEEAGMVLHPPTGSEPVARPSSVQVPLHSYPKPNPSHTDPNPERAPKPPTGADAAAPLAAQQEPREKRQKQPRRETWRRVPQPFHPTDEHRRIARERGLDFNLELAKYLDHEFDKPKSDADATFRNWLRNARPTVNGAPVRPDPPGFIPFEQRPESRRFGAPEPRRGGPPTLAFGGNKT
jgi:hypothetical protein